MPRPFAPSVHPEIFELRPDYCALSIVADGINNGERNVNDGHTADIVAALEPWPVWGDAHLRAWRSAYRGFGAKPQRTPSSAEALVSRFRSAGRLPRINPVVDLYNALSVQFAIPIGGENRTAYVGSPVLKRSTGHDTFDTVNEGVPVVEVVPAGEVVWADEVGVTCRRWNWRQGWRTRIDEATTQMWFVLERLEPMPIQEVLTAGERLVAGLRSMSVGAAIHAVLIDRHGTTEITEPAPSDRAAPGSRGPPP